ncbi:MAG: DDE-type integrase/transposase/recombinase, partial [Verrucomicrobia bacterium]|nr:DDE-type integrase/transposase/recombinase [Verrucomicrobiota bacterium]
RCERLSVFLRKRRSDRGTGRLSSNVEKTIDTAIKSVYLTAEKPTMTAVTEEVYLQCFKNKIKKKPAPNTIRARILALSDHLRVEKREGKKRAAEKYEPIKGHFPGADRPLAVAQIDHTPMDVIVVDEEHRQPIQRPLLTVVIDVYSRMVLGFAIYLEKPSAFTTGLAIAHAVLPKEDWLAGVGVQAEWPCWGKMRTIHCDNAKEFRGTVIGRACQDHDIAVEHRPPREPRYGGHIERGFGTWLTRARRLKGTTFSNVEQKGDYDSEGRAIMTRAELEKWFTIYVAKVYANSYHSGIKTTPLAKYKEGILGTADRSGSGLPDRVAEPTAFMLDFMPFEERTIQEYGVVIDHIFFWDDALRPWIHARDPEDSKRPRKFTFRIIPRDMREVYFRDPTSNTYIPIPYRDRTRPPVSRWEIQAAEKRLREAGYARVDEVLIFQAVEEMRRLEQESEHKTKKARRAREMRHRPPRQPSATPVKPSPGTAMIAETGQCTESVEAFEGIVEPEWP